MHLTTRFESTTCRAPNLAALHLCCRNSKIPSPANRRPTLRPDCASLSNNNRALYLTGRPVIVEIKRVSLATCIQTAIPVDKAKLINGCPWCQSCLSRLYAFCLKFVCNAIFACPRSTATVNALSSRWECRPIAWESSIPTCLPSVHHQKRYLRLRVGVRRVREQPNSTPARLLKFPKIDINPTSHR